jgi:hypothetical protein
MMEKGKSILNYYSKMYDFIYVIFRGGSGHYTAYALDDKDGN